MLFFVFLILGAVTSSKISYEAGKLYTYDFHSASRIEAMNSEQETRIQQFAMTCTANFMCMYAGAGEFLFEMTAKDVRISQNIDGDYSVLTGEKSDLESVFARPIVFTLNEAGEISNVKASSEDSEEVVNVKATIVNSLRTHSSDESSSTQVELDTQGVHESHYEITDAEDETEISSYFSEKDFFYFRDPSLTEENITLSGEQTTRLSEGLVKDAMQSTYVSFTAPSDMEMDEAEISNIMMTSEGSTMLTLNKVATSNAEPFAAANAAEAMKRNYQEMKPVSFLDESFYAHRPAKEAPLEKGISKKDCPSGVDLCKSYELSYWVGNKSCGLELTGSVVAGTNKGCKKSTRNMLLGAYASLNLYVLNCKLSLADAYAEYGYVNGASQRNAVDISLFSHSIYHKPFPELPCFEKSFRIVNASKSFTAKYTVYVSVLPVTFQVGVKLSFEATAPYRICLQTWDASISLVPKATVDLFADVSASILLARGGIKLSAKMTEKLDPTAYLSIGQCRVGIKATSYTDPLTAQFMGHVQVRDCSDWCNWGPDHTYVFWKWSAPTIKKKLFDFYYQV
ncbi:putative lipid transport family protein [Monocercomonoides exilis]|uniref:putative lipid transport family protein n=1 Tax=Monocercomonoides exilis TaxID=2049356 RepID=UPI0035595A77|nr:putative lipid transport family protein [Monocercomonoides exilis]|eukprot:MONOS_15689.1-p1 / transcript=MONOS_15689.1 / gene=MONOS_15689 / organism=Monocercomonoides_exilis_PA203 / gene_product=lipid transport family protein / transcript_product=lipid transport family protein / location=Mono_scaffold01312:8194-9897(-) / protein_length=567 / sequence_SO=supercontig / SO=protein_coding / is_pseudo=false